MPTTNTIGDKFLAARTVRGWSLDEAAFQARDRLGDLGISRMKIHRLEKGIADPDRLDLITVTALARLYELSLADLGIEKEVSAIRRLFTEPDPMLDRIPLRGRFRGSAMTDLLLAERSADRAHETAP